jgi:hypothetical protein
MPGSHLGCYVDPACPVEWAHPLNAGRTSWWLRVPNSGWSGGLTFRDLARGGRMPNDGILTSGPTWVGPKGRPGGCGALSFVQASTQKVVLAKTIALSTSATVLGWTVAFWAIQAADNDNGMVLGDDTDTSNFVWLSNTVGGVRYRSNNNEDSNWTVSGANRTVWSHYVLVQRWGSNVAGTPELYRNGQSLGTGTFSNGITMRVLGQGYTSGSFGFSGSLDDVAVYSSRALSAAEVFALYNQSRRGHPDTLRWLGQRTWFPPSQAAGGAIFQPAWARGSNQWIGPGVWTC